MMSNYSNYEQSIIEIKSNRSILKYLITPTQVKVISSIKGSVPDDLIYNTIVVSQDLYIRDILGCMLFSELLSELEIVNWNSDLLPDAVTSSTGVDYNSLYKMIVKPLAWYTAYNSLISLTMPVDTSGMKLLTADYTNNTDLASFKYAAAEYKEFASRYCLQLRNYILNVLLDTKELKETYGFQQGTDGLPEKPFYIPNTNRSRGCKTNNCKF